VAAAHWDGAACARRPEADPLSQLDEAVWGRRAPLKAEACKRVCKRKWAAVKSVEYGTDKPLELKQPQNTVGGRLPLYLHITEDTGLKVAKLFW
jgi:hypothetical protein